MESPNVQSPEAEKDMTSLFDNDPGVSQNPLTPQEFECLIKQVRQGARQREDFAEYLGQTEKTDGSKISNDPVLSMKLAQGFYALDKYDQALEWLEKAGSGSTQCFLKGCSLRKLGDYEAAISQFEQAQQKGWDSFEVSMAIVDCLRRHGDMEGAQDKLKRISRVGEIRAEYHFQMGRLLDVCGDHEGAIDEYEKAVSLDSNHTEALFYLAFSFDMYGQEEQAIDYYKQCVEKGIAPVNALLNLAVLYEDDEEYYKASKCVMQVLVAYPNHPRARMFLKDIESSTVMYFDEDQERQIDRRNKVLEIPISDFELSVRSRNCLRKMNIRYLGDLLKVTEPELLAYKNFGETSLQEIKIILASKGLRLGQMLEDSKNALKKDDSEILGDAMENNQMDDEILEKPISHLNLTVRARKCLERLNINTVSDLVNCAEAELLGVKNFGNTSLVEVKHCLKALNLSLRSLNE